MNGYKLFRGEDDGASLVEVIVCSAVVVSMMSVALPMTAQTLDTHRDRQAAAFIAGKLRAAQQQAVLTTRSTGLVFERVGERWLFRVCEDGNRNGLRRAEIGVVDRCREGPFDLAVLFRGVEVSVDSGLVGPGGEPGSGDPVRFGSGDMATFAASGGARAGSVFLRGASGRHYLVRVGGATGRVRVWRHNPATHAWEDC